MLDCSAEILTQEQKSEECSPDEIVKIVFERLEIKRRRNRKRYIGIGLIACVLCGCVGAKIILNPGGRVTDQSVFQSAIDAFPWLYLR